MATVHYKQMCPKVLKYFPGQGLRIRKNKNNIVTICCITMERLYKPYFVVLCLSAAAAAESLQLCPTLCEPRDGSLPGSPVPGILQARTLEWVAISFCNAWQWKVKVKLLSRARLLATPWTAAYQAPPSMGFSRQEYWSGVPLPSPMSCELWAATSSKDQVQLYCKENSEWLLFIRDTHPGNSPSFFC